MKTAMLDAPKRRNLVLERLEDRIMLDVTLLPGQFTFFDLNASSSADADDFFIGHSGDSGEIFIEASPSGQSAPTQITIRGGDVGLVANHSLDMPVLVEGDAGEVEIYLHEFAIGDFDEYVPADGLLPAPAIATGDLVDGNIENTVVAEGADLMWVDIAGDLTDTGVIRAEYRAATGGGRLGTVAIGGDMTGRIEQDVVAMEWDGEVHEVDPLHLLDPSGHEIPYDATFFTHIILGGEHASFDNAMVYADLTLLDGFEELHNPGGVFFGNIVAEGDVELIMAGSFGTGGYAAGPDGLVDFDNATGTNVVQDTFDDVLLNTITVNGMLGSLVAQNDIYAQIVVEGDLHEILAGGNIEGEITVWGQLGLWADVGETREHPLTGETMVELDGVLYSHDDLLTGVVAGGYIASSISAESITLVMAGGNIGRSSDWASDANGAVQRHLIEATGGDIGVVWAGNNLYSRVSAEGHIEYILADRHILTANRKNVINVRGSATNLGPHDHPLINAASIGYIGAGELVAGATTDTVRPGETYWWTDVAGDTHYIGVAGGQASVTRAFGSVTRVAFNTAGLGHVVSTGSLGIVRNVGGPISVVTGAMRVEDFAFNRANQTWTVAPGHVQWFMPGMAEQAQYGLPGDAVFTTGHAAGVLGVQAMRGDVARVVATGDVGSVVADSGVIRHLDVIDGHLGLVVDGREFTLAEPGVSTSGVYGARGVGLVRVVASTALLPALQAVPPVEGMPEFEYPGGTPSWLRGSVESGAHIRKMNIENLAAGTEISAATHIFNVQIIRDTGGLPMGLYSDFLRPSIDAGGWVVSVMVGTSIGGHHVVVSDSLLDINAGGVIQTVRATGDILGDIGSADTQTVVHVASLSGSIGRQDLAENDVLAPTIWASGGIHNVSALSDIYAHMFAERIVRVVSHSGKIGGATAATAPAGAPGPGFGIVSATNVRHLSSNDGFGATVSTGQDLVWLDVHGGAMGGTLNVGRHLHRMRVFGSGGEALTGNVNVGGTIVNMVVWDGAVGGTVDVADHLHLLFVRNEGRSAVTGAVSVGGRLVRADLAGDVAAGASIDAGDGIGWMRVLGEVAGDVSVTGNLSVFAAHGPISGSVTATGNIGQLAVHNPRQTAVTSTGHIESGERMGTVLLRGDMDGAVVAGNGLNHLATYGTLRGSVNVNNGNLGVLRAINPGATALHTGRGAGEGVFVNNGSAGQVLVQGDARDSLVSVSRLLQRMVVSRDFQDSSIEADRIGAVAIHGTTDGVGQNDVIHAMDASSSFVIVANRERRVIDSVNEHTFADVGDGVRAFVG